MQGCQRRTGSNGPQKPIPFDPGLLQVRGLGSVCVFFAVKRDPKIPEPSALLLLRGETGPTMTARVPDPHRPSGSSYVAQFRTVREFVQTKILAGQARNTRMRMQRPVVVELTGVGYFTDFHGQKGLAPNGFELRPVFQLAFAPRFEVSVAVREQPLLGATWRAPYGPPFPLWR
jgi:hypothetical protein